MVPASGAASVWEAQAPYGARMTVRARDVRWRTDIDAVEPAWAEWSSPARDADCVGTWLEKRIFCPQLGPNRNGRQ